MSSCVLWFCPCLCILCVCTVYVLVCTCELVCVCVCVYVSKCVGRSYRWCQCWWIYECVMKRHWRRQTKQSLCQLPVPVSPAFSPALPSLALCTQGPAHNPRAPRRLQTPWPRPKTPRNASSAVHPSAQSARGLEQFKHRITIVGFQRERRSYLCQIKHVW